MSLGESSMFCKLKEEPREVPLPWDAPLPEPEDREVEEVELKKEELELKKEELEEEKVEEEEVEEVHLEVEVEVEELEVEVEEVEPQEEELEEEEVEVEEEKAEEEEGGYPSPPSSSSSSPSSPSSSCSVLILVPLEEGSAAAGSPSPPQSPRSSCPSPSAMAGASGSQSHQGSSSPDEEGSSTWGAPAGAQASLPDALRVKVAGLVLLLLLKYRTNQPTTRAEMLAAVSQDDQDRFPVIFRRACEYLQLVFGVDVKEVDPRERSYVLEGYLEYRQVPGSEPARYEFLWGPRAHAETSAVQVLQHILAVNSRQPGSPCLSEEAVSHEEERA